MKTISKEEKQTLIDLACAARQQAYAPYSQYQVGAVVRTASGKIYTGCNIENAAYPHVMCAERVAMFKAISEGERHFDAIAVATSNGGSPCGGCRQVMAEFGIRKVTLANRVETIEFGLEELLPRASEGILDRGSGD